MVVIWNYQHVFYSNHCLPIYNSFFIQLVPMPTRASFPLTNEDFSVKYRLQAEVAEQADALRSGRSSLYGSVGSTPTFGIRNHHLLGWCFF